MNDARDEAERAALAVDESDDFEGGRTLANLKDRLRSRRQVGSTRRHEGEPRAKAAPKLRSVPSRELGSAPPGGEPAATPAAPLSPAGVGALDHAPPPLPVEAAAAPPRGPTTSRVSRAELTARELGTVELEAPPAGEGQMDEVAAFKRRRRLLGWAIAGAVLVAAGILAAIVL